MLLLIGCLVWGGIAIYPQLIERKAMVSGVAMISSIYQGTRIIGPAIAGVIIATAGTATAFYVAGAGFLVMAAVVLGIRIGATTTVACGSTAHSLVEVISLLKNNSIYSLLIGMSFFNSFFGMSYVFLMPIFAVEIFGLGASGMGILMGSSALGALGGTILLAILGIDKPC